ncbi:hypothetical protein AN958_05265 [Leucoagaricus sp. SymC.cos]|nr:hypothetical protein AN958_05265 [Leucoagaricus sp. SymC.cos]
MLNTLQSQEKAGMTKQKSQELVDTLKILKDAKAMSKDQLVQPIGTLKDIRKSARQWKDGGEVVREGETSHETYPRGTNQSVRSITWRDKAGDIRTRGETVVKRWSSGFEGMSKRNEPGLRNLSDLERELFNLWTSAGIRLPPEKILDGQVKLINDTAQASAVVRGPSCDLHKGIWLGQIEVAVKTMRHVKCDNEIAKEVGDNRPHLLQFVQRASVLSDDHVLPPYGIKTDVVEHIAVVTPWRISVLEYLKVHPTVNKLHLLRGAAKGLQYLHSQGVIHGNGECDCFVSTAATQLSSLTK